LISNSYFKIESPTGGLELNFNIRQQKANNISRAETSYEGLELAISETEPSPPTGGTSRLFEDDFPLKYILLNAFSVNVSARTVAADCIILTVSNRQLP
jgi:hypothetical protein